jgi:hypothetical protein
MAGPRNHTGERSNSGRGHIMPTKEEALRILAEAHYDLEPEITQIYRLKAKPEQEQLAAEPIKLLQINGATIPSGVMPLRFGALPDRGIPFPSVIVEVTPAEFQKIKASELPLPKGWTLGDEIPRQKLSSHTSIQTTACAGD